LIKTIKHALNKNAWLFFAAAWVYTLSFIFTNYFSYSSSARKVAHILGEYIHGQEQSFKNLLNDTVSINAIIDDAPSISKERLLSDAQGIFAYQVNSSGNAVEIFWNTNKMSPSPQDLLKEDGNFFVTYPNGDFELIKTSIIKDSVEYFFITLIPIRWQYSIQNKYLVPHYAVSEAISNDYEIKEPGIGATVSTKEGNVLFSVKEKDLSYSDTPIGFSIFLRLVALLCLLIFINKIAAEVADKESFKSGFLLIIILFLLLRLVFYFFNFPFNYGAIKLFSAKLYYGGIIYRSLGDLLINAALALWIILFFRKRMTQQLPYSIKLYNGFYRSLGFASFIVMPLISFCFADIISSLVRRSAISFNAADFFSLSLYSFIGFLIICTLLYIWLYVTGLLVRFAKETKLNFFWQNIIIIACSFSLISVHIFSSDAALLLFVAFFNFLLIAFIRHRDNPSFNSLVNSPYFIVWALLLTALTSALIVYQNNIKEKETRLTSAKNIQAQTDSSGVFLVRLAVNNFSEGFLRKNFYRFEKSNENRFLKDSLVKNNLAAYLTKYITKVYVFDYKNAPLYNSDSTSFAVINSVIENKSNPSSVPGLYLYRDKTDNYNYIYERKIVKDSVYLGSLFALIQPKINENSTLTPQLFRQNNDISSLTESGYFFGMYDNRKLLTSYIGFNFSDSVNANQIPTTGYYFKDTLGYSQLWYSAGNNKLLVIAKKDNWFFNFVTLFCYLFVLFIILAFIVHNVNRILNSEYKKFSFQNFFRFNIRTQIQATIVGVSFMSFLVIGIATISFFILRFNNATDNQLIHSSRIIEGEIEQVLKVEMIPADIVDINDIESGGEFEKKVADIAIIHNTDVNFYSKNGVLLVSSQPYIYTKKVLSSRMDPTAFYELHYNQSTRFLQTEEIGKFSFKSIYTPVKDEHDKTIAYMNIPLLTAETELKEEISDFLVTLIILNALIFIFAGAIAVSLTGRITSSLELIGRKMKQIKIGTANEVIQWREMDDEIGMLVGEYNKMVKELENSAEALAKSEREGAWREMARQVAHEIKNPLTPMKLSIQYLQRSMEQNTPNAVELSKKLASTLIEQIDQLSKIAGDFSQFANIENVNPELFDITELIQNLVNLYKTDSNLYIHYTTPDNNVEVFLDKSQVNRLFTNLIKNAIEASGETKTAHIQIKQFTHEHNVIITITDYGSGIDEALRNKIFNPNFTTKSSGTGLGLAICKAIVENAGGKIWFATSPGEGSTFYVDLPLSNNQ